MKAAGQHRIGNDSDNTAPAPGSFNKQNQWQQLSVFGDGFAFQRPQSPERMKEMHINKEAENNQPENSTPTETGAATSPMKTGNSVSWPDLPAELKPTATDKQAEANIRPDAVNQTNSEENRVSKKAGKAAARMEPESDANDHDNNADAGKSEPTGARAENENSGADPELSAKAVAQSWERIRKQLQARLGSDVFDSWFGRLKIEEISGGVASHSVPTAFLKSWISEKYRDMLLELWQSEDAAVLRVDINIRTAVRQHIVERRAEKKAATQIAPPDALPKPANTVSKADQNAGFGGKNSNSGFAGSPLDHRHTFATFVEGASNRMCYAAARSVAEGSSGSLHFNPLYIHASVGLGKTHLLQAIAWEARTRDPRTKVLYLTAEYFMWRFASAIRDQTALSLKESLRDIDLLLIDDMQFLQGKAIQAEFCHLLNELIDSARQVVVAADRPATELESLDERVRSRLKGGVTLEIQAPDYDLRKEILHTRYQQAKAEQPGLHIPEDIRHYVARKVTTSGRDLEGAFNQLLVKHRFSDGIISFEELDRMLGHLIKSADTKRVRIEDIQRIVSRQFNVSKNDLLSNRRTRMIVRPRQIAMFLAKAMTPRSLPEIGRRFGGRDHTTVLHAVRKIEKLSSEDQKLAHEIELLKRLILE